MCTAWIAAWIWYGPGRPRRRQRAHQLAALGDERGVPPRAVLRGQRHERAVAVGPRVPARRGEQHQREQAHRLGLVRHELDEQAAEPDRLAAQVVAHERGAVAEAV